MEDLLVIERNGERSMAPRSSLNYVERWEVTEEYIALAGEFYIGDELVKRNVSVKVLKAPQLFGEQASLGG